MVAADLSTTQSDDFVPDEVVSIPSLILIELFWPAAFSPSPRLRAYQCVLLALRQGPTKVVSWRD